MADNRFKKFSSIIVDDFPIAEDRPKKDSKYLRPGLYNDCPITSVEDKGTSDKDPTWVKFKIKFQVNTGEVHHHILVPTASLLFGENKTDAVFRSLQRFCKAMGIELTKDNVNIVLSAMFSEPEKLIGFKADLVLGHDAYYAYPDHKRILVRSKDDKPVMGEDGVNPRYFPDFEAARMFCESQNMAFSRYVSIKWVNEPKTPNSASMIDKLLTSSESKKKASCPF